MRSRPERLRAGRRSNENRMVVVVIGRCHLVWRRRLEQSADGRERASAQSRTDDSASASEHLKDSSGEPGRRSHYPNIGEAPCDAHPRAHNSRWRSEFRTPDNGMRGCDSEGFEFRDSRPGSRRQMRGYDGRSPGRKTAHRTIAPPCRDSLRRRKKAPAATAGAFAHCAVSILSIRELSGSHSRTARR